MPALALLIFRDSTRSELLLDVTSMATAAEIVHGEHGFESCSFALPLGVADAFRIYDAPGTPWVVATDGVETLWEGRLDGPELRFSETDGEFSGEALGPWAALGDLPYTALWSDTSVAEWRVVRSDEISGAVPERWEIDTNNRLMIAPRKNEAYNNASIAYFTLETPAGSSRQISSLSFDYDYFEPFGGCVVGVQTRDRTYGSATTIFSLTTSGAGSSGTLTFTPADRLVIFLYNNNATLTQYTGETGARYLRMTNLRVKTTTSGIVGADEMARHVVSIVAGTNPSHLSSSTAQIRAPGIDLRDEVYEDASMADMLTRLAGLGDSGGNTWEVGVQDDRALYLRPRGMTGRTWYVDASKIDVKRTLDRLYNSVYAVYQDAGDTTQRTAVATDGASVQRFGLARRRALAVNTSSVAQATAHRDVALRDGKDPTPQAGIDVPAIYDAQGERWPLWSVRTGDTLVVRTLAPGISAEVDRIKTLVVRGSRYDLLSDTLAITPEQPLPELDTILAREAVGIRRAAQVRDTK